MNKPIVLFLFVVCSVLNLTAATDHKPTGLMVDLIEQTDRVFENGFLSNLPLTAIQSTSNPIQYVEIASTNPAFTWLVPDCGKGGMQTAYCIQVFLAKDERLLWESGWVDSSQSVSVPYDGQPLDADAVYYWRVKVKTDNGQESEWSDKKAFKTAPVMKSYQAAAYPLMKGVDTVVGSPIEGVNACFFDFSKAAFGQLLVTATTNRDGDTLRVHLGERADKGRVNRSPGGTVRYQSYPLPLTKGTTTYRITLSKDPRNTGPAAVLMPAYIGEVLPFRFCEIEGRDEVLNTLSVRRENVHYPFDESASFFACSNDTLNQIWEMCKYSIKATSFLGLYVDGDRERIPYEADALINQLCHYSVDREYSMARRTFEYLLEHPTWPTEWILQAVLIAWQDYMYTGDSRSLSAHYEVLKARTLLDLKGDNGLISTKTGLQSPDFQSAIRFQGEIRDIVDWPHTGILGLNKQEGGEADGYVFTDYNAVVNAFHYEALIRMCAIADLLGKTAESAFFKHEAEKVKMAFNNTFLDKKRGYYVDGEATDHASLHANMFPLAFGIVPDKYKESVLAFIRSQGMACSVYGAQFLMDALYRAADADYALQMLTKTDDRGWYNMIRVGSTISLEAWDDKYKPNQDWNHAWGAVPANIIPRKLMGVEPLTPGFGVVQVKPQVASLTWAKALVPTIRGAVQVEVDNKTDQYVLRLTIPANTKAAVYLPVPAYKCRYLVNGTKGKLTRVKGEPFVYAGSFEPGTYTLELNRY